MSDDGTGAIARIASPRPADEEPPRHAALPEAAPVEPTQPATDLAFNVDTAARRLVVQVVDRESGEILRSFPLVLPGVGTGADEETPRGALVDDKV